MQTKIATSIFKHLFHKVINLFGPQSEPERDNYEKAAEWIAASSDVVVFTGAGISVESGIPPFRGPDGLWSKYDPSVLELSSFHNKPQKTWKILKEIFYEHFETVEPNRAHEIIGQLEKEGYVRSVVTQNIDNLHQEGGSQTVWEFHGTYRRFECQSCGKTFSFEQIDIDVEVPECPECGGLLKPDIIFFGEGIPEPAGSKAFEEAENCDIMLVVGTTGEVMPASMIPNRARESGARIIEVNKKPSSYTNRVTEIYLEGKATEVMEKLYQCIQDSVSSRDEEGS